MNYPEKRHNYKRYKNADWKWKDIMNETRNLEENCCYNFIKIISTRYNVSHSTMKKKYIEWKTGLNIDFESENRGGHNKLFTDSEEYSLYDYINNVFISCNLSFNNEQLKLLAIQQYNSIQKEKNADYVVDEKFSISDCWVTEFKQRWRVVLSKN